MKSNHHHHHQLKLFTVKINRTLSIGFSLLFSSCTWVFSQNVLDFKKFNLYDLDTPMEMMGDTGVPNINSKNTIFIPGRRFTYNYTLTKNRREYLFAVVPGEMKRSDGTDVIDWVWLPVDSVPADRKVHPIKTVELAVYRNKKKGMAALPPEYTEIKYEYMNEGRRILHGEPTTVAERSGDIFLHPPRSYGFVFTEFNPFPQVSLPLEHGKTWSRILTLPNTWFEKAKIKFDSTSEFSNVNLEYKVVGEENVFTKIGTVTCKKIEATGETMLGNTFATFYFNEQWGFVKIAYRNVDGSELVLQLAKVKDFE